MKVEREEVFASLAKILASPIFVRSDRMSRFLRFLVLQTLEGETAKLKEYVLGLEVFDRGRLYDQRFDPIVRVEARRLRIKLQQYYQKEGRADSLRIELPARGYVPLFRRPSAEIRTPGTKLAFAVLPFRDLSTSAAQSSFADGLTDELICSLGSLDGLRVVARTSVLSFQDKCMDVRRLGAGLHADYIIEGSVRREQTRYRVCVQLIETRDGLSVWSRAEDHDALTHMEAQQRIAACILLSVRDWLIFENHVPADAFRPRLLFNNHTATPLRSM